MTQHSPAPDDYCPLDDITAAMQLEALLDRTAAIEGCIVDLGCGDGRTAIPLARSGRSVLAIDNDPVALDALRSRLEAEDPQTRANITTLQADATTLDAKTLAEAAAKPIDAALSLGHTFMLLHDPLDALKLMRVLREALSPHGFFAIDDFPHDLWYEVSEGNWQSGIAEMDPQDGSGTELWQMVWKPGEPVIAIRRDQQVNPDEIEILPTDRLHRLYSVGELRLLAACSDFNEPTRSPEEAMILFTPAR
ncbi:MAG: class I SAM-dependent methyltransferase [Phycisphaerales bacterium JB050]